jgi:Zn-finger nucleic acid-binding protein
MNCPVCKAKTLEAAELPTGGETGLTALRCRGCGGHWVAGDIYLLWVDRRGATAPETLPAADTPTPSVADVPKAKLCPQCGRLLARGRVGRGLNFSLNRCATCGGFWFDAGMWDALLARGLHDDAHHVFSPVWQAEALRQERQQQHERLMIAKLGDADFQEIRRIRKWIETHPHRSELYAVLMEGREERST